MIDETADLAAPQISAGFYKWYVAALLCLAHMVSLIDRFVMMLVTEPVREAMSLSDTQLGLLQGAGFVILYCGFAIPLGWAADVTNRRNLILCGVGLWGTATLAGAFVNSFEMLFTTRVLVGMGEACLIPAGMSLLAAYFPPQQLARAVSIFGTGAYLGQGVAFVAGGALLGALAAGGGLRLSGLVLAPWQGVFFFAGLVAAPMLLLLMTLREPGRLQHVEASFSARTQNLQRALKHIWENRSAYAPYMIATSCSSAMGYAMMSWSSSVLVRLHGLTPAEAGVLVGVAGLAAGPLGTLAGGVLLDNLNARRLAGAPLALMGGAGVLCFAATVVVIGAPAAHFAVAGVFAFILCSTTTLPATYVGMQMLTPDAYRGVAASINMLVYTLWGFGVGPTLVGSLSDVFGSLGAALLTAEALMVVGVVVMALAYRRSFQVKVLV